LCDICKRTLKRVADLRNDRLLVYSEPKGDTYRVSRELRRGESVAPLAFLDTEVPVNIFLP
jgi:hypothetical protein